MLAVDGSSLVDFSSVSFCVSGAMETSRDYVCEWKVMDGGNTGKKKWHSGFACIATPSSGATADAPTLVLGYSMYMHAARSEEKFKNARRFPVIT